MAVFPIQENSSLPWSKDLDDKHRKTRLFRSRFSTMIWLASKVGVTRKRFCRANEDENKKKTSCISKVLTVMMKVFTIILIYHLNTIHKVNRPHDHFTRTRILSRPSKRGTWEQNGLIRMKADKKLRNRVVVPWSMQADRNTSFTKCWR